MPEMPYIINTVGALVDVNDRSCRGTGQLANFLEFLAYGINMLVNSEVSWTCPVKVINKTVTYLFVNKNTGAHLLTDLLYAYAYLLTKVQHFYL